MKNTFLSPPPSSLPREPGAEEHGLPVSSCFGRVPGRLLGQSQPLPLPHLVKRVYRSPAAPRFWGCRTPRAAALPGAPRCSAVGAPPETRVPPPALLGKLPKLPPRCCRWDPHPGRGKGAAAPSPPPLPARSPAICTAFVGFFNAANVYHLPNRLDRFCFLSRGGCEPPRLPRSRLPHRHGLIWYSARRPPHLCMQDKVF